MTEVYAQHKTGKKKKSIPKHVETKLKQNVINHHYLTKLKMHIDKAF